MLDEGVLGKVDILIFVHKDVVELLLIVFQNVGPLLEKTDPEKDEIIEIQGAALK